jgi:hypothetical protein
MSGNSASIPGYGGGNWQNPVTTLSTLPTVGNLQGDYRVTLDTGFLYQWRGNVWFLIATSGSNASVGLNGQLAPTSSTEVGGINPSGLLEGLLVDANGALVVNSSGSFGVQTVRVIYNEVASVPVGVETDINTYTAPGSGIAYLLGINTSGQNIGLFNIYLNGALFDRQYLSYTLFNLIFDYKTDSGSVPGYVVPSGSTILVKAINSGMSSVLYNARIFALEVT